MSIFRFHHYGIAVKHIESVFDYLGYLVDGITKLSGIVYDPLQQVYLYLFEYRGKKFELVSGDRVSRYYHDNHPYHVCFDVADFDFTVKAIKDSGDYIMVSEPQPAILFNNRRVVFFYSKEDGLFELLERGQNENSDIEQCQPESTTKLSTA